MDTDELPITESPRWTVEPVFKRQTKDEIKAGKPKELKHYVLIYAGTAEKKATGERDVERLREMARFCNKRGLVPREPVQCLADTNLPAPPPAEKRRFAAA